MVENAQLIWAGLAIWLAWLGVCLWEAKIAKKSLEVLWKNPELSWTLMVYTILWIALTESAAIYWLIIAFQIVGSDSLSVLQALWAGLAIWLAWFGAGYWEWQVAENALESLHRNPANKGQVLTFMILFIALVESAAIYWLITAFNILGK